LISSLQCIIRDCSFAYSFTCLPVIKKLVRWLNTYLCLGTVNISF
jgi:hypothetical protein